MRNIVQKNSYVHITNLITQIILSIPASDGVVSSTETSASWSLLESTPWGIRQSYTLASACVADTSETSASCSLLESTPWSIRQSYTLASAFVADTSETSASCSVLESTHWDIKQSHTLGSALVADSLAYYSMLDYKTKDRVRIAPHPGHHHRRFRIHRQNNRKTIDAFADFFPDPNNYERRTETTVRTYPILCYRVCSRHTRNGGKEVDCRELHGWCDAANREEWEIETQLIQYL